MTRSAGMSREGRRGRSRTRATTLTTPKAADENQARRKGDTRAFFFGRDDFLASRNAEVNACCCVIPLISKHLMSCHATACRICSNFISRSPFATILALLLPTLSSVANTLLQLIYTFGMSKFAPWRPSLLRSAGPMTKPCPPKRRCLLRPNRPLLLSHLAPQRHAQASPVKAQCTPPVHVCGRRCGRRCGPLLIGLVCGWVWCWWCLCV